MAQTKLVKVADEEYLDKELKILNLFKTIYQVRNSQEYTEIIKTFKVEENKSKYRNLEVVEKNLKLWQKGVVPKNNTFYVQNKNHQKEATALFELLYYAIDFDTFYKTAVVTKYFYNPEIFLYSISVAILHRKDCYGFILPPIHEVNPHYFFNADVIIEAYKFKQINSSSSNNLNSKVSDTYLEDIGILSYFYNYNLHYPFWMNGPEFGLQTDKVGELFYYTCQQTLAHYNLERFSIGLDEVEEISHEECVKKLLSDDTLSDVQKTDWKTELGNFERRILDVIDSGYVTDTKGDKIALYGKEGMSLLGTILLSNANSPNPRFHCPILTTLLQCNKPNSLDFYRVLKKIVNIFLKYKENLPPYTETELSFPGICVTEFKVGPLITYYEDCVSDLSNIVYYSEEELTNGSNFAVTLNQKRLNCKPFTYEITVNCDKDQGSIVKVYFGPKYDTHGKKITLTSARRDFVLLDRFIYGLKSGTNVIKKSSLDSRAYIPDKRSFKELNEQVVKALNRNSEFRIDGRENWYFFPRRHMLPKGSSEGSSFQIYIIIYKFVPYKQMQPMEFFYPKIGTAALYYNDVALGYPLDRDIPDEEMFMHIPNCISHEVKVYHKNIDVFDN